MKVTTQPIVKNARQYRGIAKKHFPKFQMKLND